MAVGLVFGQKFLEEESYDLRLITSLTANDLLPMTYKIISTATTLILNCVAFPSHPTLHSQERRRSYSPLSLYAKK